MYFYRLFDRQNWKKNDKVSFDMTYSYGFYSIPIARFHSQSRTGGEAYSRDKNTCAGTWAENGRGFIY